MVAESTQAIPITADASLAGLAPGVWPEAVRIEGEHLERQGWEVSDGDLSGVLYASPTTSTSLLLWSD
jgi:hypothetical protein